MDNATYIDGFFEDLTGGVAQIDRAAVSEVIDMLFEELIKQPQAKKFSELSIRGMLMSAVLGYYQYFQRVGIIS